MAECLLHCVLDLLHLEAGVVDAACQREPDLEEAVVIVDRLEHRQSDNCQLFVVIDRPFTRPAEVLGCQRARKGARDIVARRLEPFGRGAHELSRLERVAHTSCEIHQQVDVWIFCERDGALQQRPRGGWIVPPTRAPARCPQALRRLGLEAAIEGAELDQVAGGPFEVVAKDLVELNQVMAVLFKPGGEALV